MFAQIEKKIRVISSVIFLFFFSIGFEKEYEMWNVQLKFDK